MTEVITRETLAREITGLRIVAMLAFSLVVFTAFTRLVLGSTENLLLLSFGHFLLAPVAGYASIRLGVFLTFTIILAVIQLILDLTQTVLHLTPAGEVFPLNILFTFWAVLFVAFDILYLVTAWRLISTTASLEKKGNTRRTSPQFLFQQEANTLRLTALFGLTAAFFVLILTVLTFGFNSQVGMPSVFNVSHLLLALIIIFFGTNGSTGSLVCVGLVIVQIGLDVTAIVLRVCVPFSLFDLSLTTIGIVFFLLISIPFLLIDAVYFVSLFGLLSIRTSVQPILRTTNALIDSTIRPLIGNNRSFFDGLRVAKRQ